MAEKQYICIHGHFYQPPRENAWLEAVEIQDSAHPYHDWNERITAECYATNAYSRILDDEGRITNIVNNYEKISFNFGPTLLDWMETNAPAIYTAILDADKKSAEHYSGHGSALAQAYNHMILPLSNHRDKYTQIFWGIRDFEHRFGRPPEGMWLPETAVDLETLEIMAQLGIQFTILTPYQAARTRKIGEKLWCDVGGGRIDPKMPYIQRLSGDKDINIFFYDGPISQAVAFEGLLNNGEEFAKRLADGFVNFDNDQLVHIATDGESYGHHSRFGDMALAYAIKYIEDNNLGTLTNYGEYLENHPPTQEVEIIENTSWSCFHGIERWRSDCGCGSVEGQNQKWRKPLREAMDLLRDSVAPIFEKESKQYFNDPWEARNNYIEVILDRSPETLENFLQRNTVGLVSPADRVRMLKLFEIQRHAMLMYTSCGWFFNDLSRIETVQIIQYAGRMLQLCSELFEGDFESPFLKKLAEAKSNFPDQGDGKCIYKRLIKPAMVDLRCIAAHYGISSLFQEYPDQSILFCYHIRGFNRQGYEAGVARLEAGRVEVISGITLESLVLQFAVLYTGDHNLSCGIIENRHDKNFEKLMRNLSNHFDRAEFTEIIRIMDKYCDGSIYSLGSLLRDGQRKIIKLILQSKVSDALAMYHQFYHQNIPLMRFLNGSSTPCPEALYNAGKLALNGDLKVEFTRDILDHQTIEELLKEAHLAGIAIDAETLEFTLRKNLEQKAQQFEKNPDNYDLLKRLTAGVNLVYKLPFNVNLRMLQTIFYGVAQRELSRYREKKKQGDKSAADWVDTFKIISEKLNIRIP